MVIEYSSQLELSICYWLSSQAEHEINLSFHEDGRWWQHHSDLTDFSKVCWKVVGVDFIYNSSRDSVNPECQLSAITIRLLGAFGIINEEIKSILQLAPKEKDKTSRLSGKEKSIPTHQKTQKNTPPEWQGLNLSFSHSTFKVSLSSYSHFWGERLSCQELVFARKCFVELTGKSFCQKTPEHIYSMFKAESLFSFWAYFYFHFLQMFSVKKISVGSWVQTEQKLHR